MRFSTPYCQPLKQIGDDCRPASSTPVNMTLSYPHGLKINLINAHQVFRENIGEMCFIINVFFCLLFQIMCPCAEGLFCNTMADAVCTLGNGMTDNDIY